MFNFSEMLVGFGAVAVIGVWAVLVAMLGCPMIQQAWSEFKATKDGQK